VPAPPPPPVEPPSCVPHYEGTNVPEAQVKTALEAAAAKKFWTVSQVTLPQNLIKAIAKQESGWQSAIVSCIGAVGTMQVLPATADWMNNRFGTSYKLDEVQGNTMLGSEYLQWLIKYFGDRYFEGDYVLRSSDCSQDPDVADYKEWCLLNAVIAAYNVGHGSVDKSATDDVPRYFINHPYIEAVRALMGQY
jgi:soluble lytic murein transglycosylase-like protein